MCILDGLELHWVQGGPIVTLARLFLFLFTLYSNWPNMTYKNWPKTWPKYKPKIRVVHQYITFARKLKVAKGTFLSSLT